MTALLKVNKTRVLSPGFILQMAEQSLPDKEKAHFQVVGMIFFFFLTLTEDIKHRECVWKSKLLYKPEPFITKYSTLTTVEAHMATDYSMFAFSTKTIISCLSGDTKSALSDTLLFSNILVKSYQQ